MLLEVELFKVHRVFRVLKDLELRVFRVLKDLDLKDFRVLKVFKVLLQVDSVVD